MRVAEGSMPSTVSRKFDPSQRFCSVPCSARIRSRRPGTYSINSGDSFTVMLEYEMRYHEELASFQKTVAELEAISGESLEG